ncbi:MAG: hypothetical protein LBN40_03825 [Oscillospiraceae bacterium]|jgi:hypothetical protein|nr:hypothetical protein [Oscillospiraceae bacterium]
MKRPKFDPVAIPLLICEMIRRFGEMRGSEILGALSFENRVPLLIAEDILDDLTQNGYVLRTGEFYVLTPKGEIAADITSFTTEKFRTAVFDEAENLMAERFSDFSDDI